MPPRFPNFTARTLGVLGALAAVLVVAAAERAAGGPEHHHGRLRLQSRNGRDVTGEYPQLQSLADALADHHVVLDGEAVALDEHGVPNDTMPTMRMTFAFEATDTGSRFRSTTFFNSVESMEQLVQMGMMDGMKSAMSQIDTVLADLASFAVGRATDAQLLNDRQARVSRIIRGSVDQVWRAHHEPALMRRWLLGPDGWTMPVCDMAQQVGDPYRYEWASADGAQRFGFEGELLESAAPHRAVTTERMIDTPGPSTRNELTLTAVDGGTLLSLVITYPSKELRDMILATGMTTGMEASTSAMCGSSAQRSFVG